MAGLVSNAVKIFTTAHLPDHLAKDWLQHLRDFDTKHPGCHFEVAAEAPDMSLGEMIEALLIEPGFNFTKVIERKKP